LRARRVTGIMDPLTFEFGQIITRQLGFELDDDRSAVLTEVLWRRSRVRGVPAEQYVRQLERGFEGEELRFLARELTVPETYFFRHPEQLRAFTDVVRALAHERRGAGPIRVLSAGCASGEEPYTIAMIVQELADDEPIVVDIRAIDVNGAMLEKAAKARYSTWALRQTPDERRRRWFTPVGNEFVLDERIRRAVHFGEHNLLADDAPLGNESYEVMFCRNVLMYMAPHAAKRIVERLSAALVPGGYLFLGHAESLRGLSTAFHLQSSDEAFFYRRRTVTETGSEIETQRSPATPLAAESRPAPVVRDGPVPNEVEHSRALDLGLALSLLRVERFEEAIRLMDDLPPEVSTDPDVLLVRAALSVHAGRFALAEEQCERLLAVDDQNAGAHYLLALCRENARDAEGARRHDTLAAYLDPGFAMPRLHLGLLARRAGNHVASRRELDHALVLLQREDAGRLLLFGGGFSRDALMTFCRLQRVNDGADA
jgi:chemotaxis protein methyltransferase CheR